MNTPTDHRTSFWRSIVRFPSWALIAGVRCYQYLLSPLIGRECRFQPTCSHYFIGSVEHYGAIRGSWRGVMRICRCHPWHPGGFDPPVPSDTAEK